MYGCDTFSFHFFFFSSKRILTRSLSRATLYCYCFFLCVFLKRFIVLPHVTLRSCFNFGVKEVLFLIFKLSIIGAWKKMLNDLIVENSVFLENLFFVRASMIFFSFFLPTYHEALFFRIDREEKIEKERKKFSYWKRLFVSLLFRIIDL